MPKTIHQSVTLPASAADLYQIYMDPARHTAMTGSPVTLHPNFRAFDGALSGKILHTEPERLIVQTWRSRNFGAGDLDSILILTFSEANEGAAIDMVHVNVADCDYEAVKEGWDKYYWTPWRNYLLSRMN